MNKRLTPRDRNAIKGGLRRAFSRSELHAKVIEASLVEHTDPTRPRVKKWCLCNVCKLPEAKSYVVVDHILPLVPVDTKFEDMSLDTVVDRLWCEEHNLQAICPECHDKKSASEREERKKNKRRSKK